MSLNGNPFSFWRPGPPLSKRDKVTFGLGCLGVLAPFILAAGWWLLG